MLAENIILTDLIREQAWEKHLSGDAPAAIMLVTEVIIADPSNTRVAMDIVQLFIDIGELEQANGLYALLPESTRETEMGKALSGQHSFATLVEKSIALKAFKAG